MQEAWPGPGLSLRRFADFWFDAFDLLLGHSGLNKHRGGLEFGSLTPRKAICSATVRYQQK